MIMPDKHPDTRRFGGPGSSHEDRNHPDKPQSRGAHPVDKQSTRHSGVSGGGGEPDSHHAHDPLGKAGR
jgi:hypothetical protein